MLKAVAGGTGGSGSGGITISTTTITGGTNTRVLFDDNGVVGEDSGLSYVKGTKTLTLVGAGVAYSGAISAAAWTTTGLIRQHTAATLTDTSSSGTVAAAYTNAFGGNTIAASSATTYTRYAGANFTTPVAGTNVTMTSAIALAADNISVGGAPIGGNALAVTGAAVVNGNANVANAASAWFFAGYLGVATSGNGLIQINSATPIGWQNPASAGGTTFRTSLSEVSAGLLQIGTTAANALGSLNLTNLTATGVITVPGAAVALLTTAATATSGAGAGLGTLSNAPSAGNPTSWLKVVDGGVTRYVPAW